MDRTLIRWILIIGSIVGGVIWLLSTISSGFTIPAWEPAASFLALCVAVAMP